MSDINLGVGVEGQAAAVQQLAQITQAQAQLGTTAERANRQAATSAVAASQSMQQFAQSGQQMAQRVQGAAGAVQSLVSALGGGDRTAGLVASVAGATAQFAAMGSLLGPAGTIVGGLIGLTTGLVSAARAADDTGESMGAMGARIATAEERVHALNAELATLAERSRIDMGVASMAEYAGEIARVEERLESLTMAFDRMDPTLAGSTSERSLSAEIRRERERLEELRGLRSSAATEEADMMMEDLSSAANPTAPTRRGGRRESAAVREAREWRDLLGAINDTAEGGLAIIEETRAAADVIGQTFGQGGGAADRRDGFRAGQDGRRSPTGSTSMFAEQAEAMREFERGYVSSIDAVASAYDHLRDVSTAAANDVVRSGRFMERGMVAVGNNITEVVGSRMLGAFESALGAWLDGSKSFVEAAEAMAKGVIRSLVQEGIVQAVTETARGIADLASYQYATAGMHFAAAAAWGAVAGVAGAVGAATGSFGGSGAGAGSGPSQREMAERDRNDERGAGTTVINLYPGAFATEDERANALRRALNYNARMGRRLDRRLVA